MCRRYFNIKKGNISEDLFHALRNVKELQQLHFISEQHIYSLLLQRSIRKGWLPLSNCFRKFEEDKQCSRSSERSEGVEDVREAVLVDCRQEELANNGIGNPVEAQRKRRRFTSQFRWQDVGNYDRGDWAGTAGESKNVQQRK